ncbi:MAG: GNAT family N-acetyltransferase [Pseudomonadota bacterium]
MIARPLAASDGAAWHRLLVVGAEEFPDGFLQSTDEVRAIPSDRHGAIAGSGDWHGVFAGAALIGFAALRRGGPSRIRHRASLGPVFVAATHQGTGAADRLMNHLVDTARADGIAWLDLWVAAANPRAHAFYRRHGFTDIARRPDAVRLNDASATDILMTRHLEPPAPGG